MSPRPPQRAKVERRGHDAGPSAPAGGCAADEPVVAPAAALGLLMTAEEIAALVEYRQPVKQVEELHRQGFWRARRGAVSGRVILERSHYEAVCGGARLGMPIGKRPPEPKLQPA